MGHHGKFDYPTLTKRSFAVGVALFALGVAGELLGHAVFGSLPAWEETLFLNMEALGIVVALFAPLLFGIILPLTE